MFIFVFDLISHLLTYVVVVAFVQRGGERVSSQKEGICPMPGEPRRRLRKPEQDADRGTKIAKRTLLPERRQHLAHGSHVNLSIDSSQCDLIAL